jgi:hypothetical protein
MVLKQEVYIEMYRERSCIPIKKSKSKNIYILWYRPTSLRKSKIEVYENISLIMVIV